MVILISKRKEGQHKFGLAGWRQLSSTRSLVCGGSTTFSGDMGSQASDLLQPTGNQPFNFPPPLGSTMEHFVHLGFRHKLSRPDFSAQQMHPLSTTYIPSQERLQFVGNLESTTSFNLWERTSFLLQNVDREQIANLDHERPYGR
jgi:hypothetical protein